MTIVLFVILLSSVGVWNITDAWYSIVTWLGKDTPTGKPKHDLVIRVVRGLLGLLLLWLAYLFGTAFMG